MRQLLPATTEPPSTVADLAHLYAMPEPRTGRSTFLRTNFIATIDGAAQGPDGRSGSINNATDRALFALQRALSDVVLVGAGTVRAERYGPAAVDPSFADARAEAGHDVTPPPIAVVSGRLDVGEAVLADSRTIVVTTAAAPRARRDELAERVDVAVCGEDELDLPAVLEALADRGHRRILCEGGPMLVGGLAAAGLVDEVCLTLAPFLRGGEAERMLRTEVLSPMSRWEPVSLILDEDGYLLGRWLLAGR